MQAFQTLYNRLKNKNNYHGCSSSQKKNSSKTVNVFRRNIRRNRLNLFNLSEESESEENLS